MGRLLALEAADTDTADGRAGASRRKDACFSMQAYGCLDVGIIMKTHTFAMRACALEYRLGGSAQHPGAHTMLCLMVYTVYQGDADCVDGVAVVDDTIMCDVVGEWVLWWW